LIEFSTKSDLILGALIVLTALLTHKQITHLFYLFCSNKKRQNKVLLLFFLLLQFCLILFISNKALHNFAFSADEYAYQFQAKTYAIGRIANPPPPIPARFGFSRILIKNNMWLSQYPPGWPLILSLGYIFDFPTELINPILATLSLLLTVLIANRLFGRAAGVLAGIALGLSPFYLFNSASYFAHTSCSLTILLTVYISLRIPHSRLAALLTGFFAAYSFSIRYFTAVLAYVVSTATILQHVRHRNFLKIVALITAGAMIPLSLNFVYNYYITGNLLVDPQSWYYTKGKTAAMLTTKAATQSLPRVKALFTDYLIWTHALLLLLYPISLIYLWLKKSLHWCLMIPISLVLGHLFFPSDGVWQYGPRYYYEGYPFLIIAISGLACSLHKSAKVQKIQLIIVSIVLLIVVSRLIMLPKFIKAYSNLIMGRASVFQAIDEFGIKDAGIFLAEIGTTPHSDMMRNNPDLSGSIFINASKGIDCSITKKIPRQEFYSYEYNQGNPKILRVCN